MRSASGAVDVGVAVDAGRADDDLVVAAPLDARRRGRASSVEHRLDVADARHVAHDDLVGR